MEVGILAVDGLLYLRGLGGATACPDPSSLYPM